MSLLYNYLLFDAARAEMNLYTAMELNKNYQSLYKGSAEEDLEGVAPYLFTIKENTPFADWYFKEGWNKSWGTLVFANAAFEDVYKHFRKFLMVKTEDGQQLYFRFYDPRVLRIFLPTAEPTQLKELFGPIRHFTVESEKPAEALQFWLENSTLKTKTMPFDQTVFHKAEAPSIEIPSKEEEKETVTVSSIQKEEEPEVIALVEKTKKKWNFYTEE